MSQAVADRGPGEAERSGRMARWRHTTFGAASEEPYRRRYTDWWRVGIALVLFIACCLRANHVTPSDSAVFQFFSTLPEGLKSMFEALYRLGALWAVGLVAAAALVARRWRLARDLLISGALAWALGRVLGELVSHASVEDGVKAVTRSGATPDFPFVPLAVVVAVVCAASPYLTRPTRRLGGLLVISLAFAAMYLGTAYPVDLLGALLLGWGIAAAIHLAFGSPGGRPTTRQVEAALDELAVSAEDVHLAPDQRRGRTLLLARDDEGPLHISVIGRDEADAQFLAKLGRSLLYRDSGAPLTFTRLQQVEHQAYSQLLAAAGGTPVPPVLVAGTAGPGAALLVERDPIGPRVSELDAARIDDALLEKLWTAVRQLHGARVAHGCLNLAHIVVTAEGPVLVDFVAASATGKPNRINRDVAELLASTAAVVGEDRAVAAAARGL